MMEVLYRLIERGSVYADAPIVRAGGRPSKGTPKDRRLKGNKSLPPRTMPKPKGK